MSVLLGIDTGGTFTDAVVMDAAETRVLGRAKRLTTRPDLAPGVAAAIGAALADAGVAAGEVGLVSLSTTLATNALVEGQGGRVALVFIGFEPGDLERAGLAGALAGDPVILLAGGHGHAGEEAAPLDLAGLAAGLARLPGDVQAVAVAARFATRNPAHEIAARAAVRAATGLPVNCSHELSAGLNGPKRALTAVLNARLLGLVARLIGAVETNLAARGIAAPLMVVRGDGALMTAAQARERPVETILSGPAASVAGAGWLAGAATALVADIGGTTTDVCLLRDGRPAIDPEGAQVGPHRTMVRAVAMRTTGLGGDSEVHLEPGLEGRLRLGPRRVVPLALAARDFPAAVHGALDAGLRRDTPGAREGRLVLPLWAEAPELPGREAALVARLASGPQPVEAVAPGGADQAALDRLWARGLVQVAALSPTDAAHVLGHMADWDAEAARKGCALMARRRTGRGDRLAAGPEALAAKVVASLEDQTCAALLEAAFAADGGWEGADPATLARHALVRAGLAGHRGAVRLSAGLGVPVVGLGASAPVWYAGLGARLGTGVVLPEHAGVANAIGAVVGRVAVTVEGVATAPAPGVFVAHLPGGPQRFGTAAAAMAALVAGLEGEAIARAAAAGAEEARAQVMQEIVEAEVEGQRVFVEGRASATAQGRARLA